MNTTQRSFAALAAALCAGALTLAMPDTAQAQVRVVSGQFASSVQAGRPSGDAASIAAARNAIYFVVVENNAQPTTVTVVWKLDGREVARQSLDVGRAPRWRTWATQRTRGAHSLVVEVLDAAGTQLHTETATLPQ